MAKSEPPRNEENDREASAEVTLAAVIHDVNQMLTVITGRAGLLLDQTDNPGQNPHLKAIELAANDAAMMLRRLSLSGSQPKIGVGAASLHEVAEQARLLVWPLDKPQYSWRNQLDPSLTAAVPAQVLREVLNNVLLNALAAMPTGGEVVLESRAGADSHSVILRVCDNGPGLPHENPEWVFGVGNSRHKSVGRGIGLSGCRQLICAAGGQMRAEAREGGGASFVLTLPLAESDTALILPDDISSKLPSSVLLVDDEAAVREMLTDVLTAWGCEVAAFRDADSALKRYVTGSAQVALLDKNLPGLSGTDLAIQLRQSDSHLGIIMASGWRKKSVDKTDSAIIDFVVDKPLAMSELRRLLQQAYALEQQRKEGNRDDEAASASS